MLRIGQVEATATQEGKYTDGSVAGGIAATRLRAAAFNAMQEELAHIVESAGILLDINDMTQVMAAIKKLTLSRAHPFADIKADGSAAVAEALTNLGIGEAAKLGVATNSQMAAGTAANLLPSVAAVMSLFSKRNFATKDYIRIPDVPGGLIIQFGTSVIIATSGSLAFATPFPNSALAFVALKNGSDGRFISYSGLILNGVSVYGFLNTTPTNIDTFNWLAIGY
ncbi:TPA: gp53-like domain-containing protein [Enterobacter roggenkampii]